MANEKLPEATLKELAILDEKAKSLEPLLFRSIWSISGGNRTTSQENPIALVLGGQPGAGKSSTINNSNELVREMGSFVTINGDAFRAFHPSLVEICKLAEDQHPNFTQPFVGRMVQACVEQAMREQKNFVVEGTFRTFETPDKTLKEAKNAGYKVLVAIKTCPKEVSLQNTIDRYQEELKTVALGARPVAPETHDHIVKVLPGNADRVLKESPVDRFCVFDDKGMIFDSNKDKDMPSKTIKSVLYQVERERLARNPEALKQLLTKQLGANKANQVNAVLTKTEKKEHDRER